MYATRKAQIGRTKAKIQELFSVLMNVLFLYLGARIKPYFVQCVKTKTTQFFIYKLLN
jgi:hypothetical protein